MRKATNVSEEKNGYKVGDPRVMNKAAKILKDKGGVVEALPKLLGLAALTTVKDTIKQFLLSMTPDVAD